MDRRIVLARPTDADVRKHLAGLVSASIADIRGDFASSVLSYISSMDLTRSHIEPFSISNGSLLSSDALNGMLDMIYTDLLIQYGDAYRMYDYEQAVKRLFSSTLFSLLVAIGAAKSRLRDYSALSGNQYTFNHAIHESFNLAVNYSSSTYKLVINPVASCMRLPSIDDIVSGPERCDLLLQMVSQNMRVLDSSDQSNGFGSNPLSPFFINAFTNSHPSNRDYAAVALSSYPGAVIDLIVRFPGLVPSTRITFSGFSSSQFEILGIYGSTIEGARWDMRHLSRLETYSIAQDDIGAELNYELNYSRELHILIHLAAPVVSKETTVIDPLVRTQDYFTKFSENLRDIGIDGFNDFLNIGRQMEELASIVSSKSLETTSVLESGGSFYTFGVYDLRVSNSTYASHGEYESQVLKSDGSVLSVDAVLGGTPSVEDPITGILDAHTMLSIFTDKEEYFVTPVGDDHQVRDAAILRPNMVMSGNVLSVVEDHPVVLDTHWIPDDAYLGEFRIYGNHEAHPIPSGCILIPSNNGLGLALPTDFCELGGFYPGSVVTMSYRPSGTDRTGGEYNPGSLNLLRQFGRPNIRDNDAANISSEYIYLRALADSGGSLVERKVGYAHEEYNTVYVSGEIQYELPIWKGGLDNQPTATDIENLGLVVSAGLVYVPRKNVIGPVHDFYFGAVHEPCSAVGTDTVEGIACVTFVTAHPYIKDTLKVRVNGVLLPYLHQYSDDLSYMVYEDYHKRTFYIEAAMLPEGQVEVSYVPIDHSAASQYIGSNVARHNGSERFSALAQQEVELTRYPFVDPSVISVDSWDFSNGIFHLKDMYSVIYEPVIVHVNGSKAVNLTAYRNTQQGVLPRGGAGMVTYTVENGNRIVFDRIITGTVVVHYYIMTDVIRSRIHMYRSDYKRNDMTPVLSNYTLLLNVRR